MNVNVLLKKYKDIIPYGIFGLLTTAVNVTVYWVGAHLLNFEVVPSTVVAWIVAVTFAYVTNRKWVFQSEAKTILEIRKEIMSFYVCRLATGILDWICMYIFVDLLCFNDVVIKVMTNILVIILNYVASKIVIFKKNVKRNSREEH